MPCSPSDVSINVPTGPSGPSIPGFGVPFSISLPNINPFPPGFPEDLLNILNTLQLLIPSGPLLPQLNLNFGKDIFDAIMKLLDQFMPFLMLYKFFLPILNIIVCIIEVLCAIPNPFKLIPALIKLFTQCIPAFLLLFPIFALIIMIISLILLIIALIEYIIQKIIALVLLILRNILALVNAFQEFNVNSVLAIAHKIGASLCIFQNLFVLLAIFNIIIQIIKDILGLAFAIPPCDDNNPQGCCTSEVCPAIAKNPYTRTTGTLQYLNEAGIKIPTTLPAPFDFFNFDTRVESWQLYDIQQQLPEMFLNIIDAFDVPPDPATFEPPFFKQVFFPTDSNFTAKTTARQAAYTVDLRVFYDPALWGRTGLPRFIRIKDCIVLQATSLFLTDFENLQQILPTGVLSLAGGKVYEDNGKTGINGFEEDGVTQTKIQGTLNTFLHKAAISSSAPVLSPTDGHTFDGNVEYTFKPNAPILMSKNLITLGCIPDISIAKGFVNTALAGDVALKTAELQALLNSPTFPNPDTAQQCLTNALNILRVNLTAQGVADFQSTATACLQTLQNECNASLSSLIGIGFDPCQSTFTISPPLQFTSKPIQIQVDLNEHNALSLTKGITGDIAATLAPRIQAIATLGQVSDFTFDGYQFFTANITSKSPGPGQIMISFDNNIFCTNIVSATPSHTLQVKDYQFVYTPTQGQVVAVGDKSDGQPARDASDLSNDDTGRDGG